MIIIADSGSTKTNWLTEKKELFQTIGFNPLFDTTESILNELMKHELLLKERNHVTEVFFYGASCSSEERNKVVYEALKDYFTKATHIKVDHDLKAAALATFDGRKGIACILGTGSNSCLYDGREIHEDVPALGYVLGDEGGGAYFGKKLVALYLYNRLPAETTKILREDYHLEKEEILKKTYKEERANVYLAHFAKVMTNSPDKDFMNKLAEQGFTEFFEYHVCCYKNYKLYPVHFVGSIAFCFKEVLQKVSEKFGCELGNIDRNPIYSLLDWHIKNPESASGKLAES